MTIFNLVAPAITSTARCALPKFSQINCVLLKLRLGVPDQDIAYHFKVSRSTISRSFQKWVDAMYVRLKPLIIWPTIENVQKTMPSALRNYFGRCIAIIDCFEVFIDRPSSLVARAQTYSNYKSHNTAKYLIAITPQGTISFVSKGWGGRVFDRHLTEECRLLQYLNPGNQILADRGFNIVHEYAYMLSE